MLSINLLLVTDMAIVTDPIGALLKGANVNPRAFGSAGVPYRIPENAKPVTPMQKRAADQTNFYLESGAQTAPPAAYSTNNPNLDMALQRGAQLQLGARDGREAVRQLMEEQVRRGERPASDLPQGSAVVADTPAFNPNGVNIIGGKRFAFRNGIPVGGEGLNIPTVLPKAGIATGGFTPSESAQLNAGVEGALRSAVAQPSSSTVPVAAQMPIPVDVSPAEISVPQAAQSQVSPIIEERPINIPAAVSEALVNPTPAQQRALRSQAIQDTALSVAGKDEQALQEEKARLYDQVQTLDKALSEGKDTKYKLSPAGTLKPYQDGKLSLEDQRKMDDQIKSATSKILQLEIKRLQNGRQDGTTKERIKTLQERLKAQV